MTTREEQRREHNEQKELESLRRVFEQLDKTKAGKIGFKELNEQLIKLDYRAKRVEVEDMIWEVDEDCDHCVSWDEFKLMFHRCRNDRVRGQRRAARGARREARGAQRAKLARGVLRRAALKKPRAAHALRLSLPRLLRRPASSRVSSSTWSSL